MNFHRQHAGGMIATGLLQGAGLLPVDRPGLPEKITVGLFMACLRPLRFHPFYSSP
ncbi:hypothetical protein KZ774_04710 [Escherichia coli]|nr:hypothetical protein [Escherichia coli]